MIPITLLLAVVMALLLLGLMTDPAGAVLAGATSFTAITDWRQDLDEQVQARLGLTRDVPVGTTVGRLPTRLDATLVSAVLASWYGPGPQIPGQRPRPPRTQRPCGEW